VRKCKAVRRGSVFKCKARADISYLSDVLCVAITFVYRIVHTCTGATDGTACAVSAKGVMQAVRCL
jgi:hypothetical protein